jgi:hypothetical protein
MPRDGLYSAMAGMPRSVYAQRTRGALAMKVRRDSNCRMPRSVYAQLTRTVLARCHGRDMDVTYQDNAWCNCRMAKSVYAHGWVVRIFAPGKS